MARERYRAGAKILAMDADTARHMPLEEFAAWMLTSARYRVDPDTGRVWNARTGVELRTFVNASGYPSVNLVFNRAVVRRITVHRLVAISVHGAEAVSGKQVAHLDGVRHRSVADNLWVAPSARDHIKYDGTDRNLTHRAPRKTTWPPCARCGTPDGVSTSKTTPDRISGARFSIDGQLCRRCYGTLQERERRRRHGSPASASAAST